MVFTTDNLEACFFLLEECQGVEQMAKHHPEGDVFIHSLQVLHHAFRESNDVDVILAAMLHDVGKICGAYGHDDFAVKMLENHASVKTLFLIEQHMRIKDYLLGHMHKLGKCTFLAQHPWLPELIQLNRWDLKGRKPGWIPRYDKELIISKLNLLSDKHFTQ